MDNKKSVTERSRYNEERLVAIGKGLITLSQIAALLDRYETFFVGM